MRDGSLVRVVLSTWLRSSWHALPPPVRKLVPQRIALWARRRFIATPAPVVRATSQNEITRKLIYTSNPIARHLDADQSKVAQKLISEASKMAPRDPRAAILTSAATIIHDVEATHIAHLDTLQAAGRMDEACAVLDLLLERQAGAEQSPTIKKLKRSDADLYSMQHSVLPRAPSSRSSDSGKLLYVMNNSLPYSSNGYATRGHGVVLGLQDAGFSVAVYTRPGYPIDLAATAVDNVREQDVVNGVTYNRILAPSLRDPATHDYLLRAADALEAVIDKENPGVVVAASNYRNALPALIASRRKGLPFVYEVRGFWEITRGSRDPDFLESASFIAQCALETVVAREADLALTLNGGMRDELVRRGVERDRIHLFPNSIDASRFHRLERDRSLAQQLGIPEGVPVIGYIGTFVDYEGLDDLALACAQLKRLGLQFRLLLVGNENASNNSRGAITEAIQEAAKSAGMEDWLIMPGRVPFELVEAYYSLIDIAPFPRKPWQVCELVSPLKPLEAMAMEKAVVVSSVAALSEMAGDGKVGLVFEKGDHMKLAEALARLINEPETRAALGRSAREWVVSHRTWNYCARAVTPAIRALADDSRSVSREVEAHLA